MFVGKHRKTKGRDSGIGILIELGKQSFVGKDR
jgi:hypothetical protein